MNLFKILPICLLAALCGICSCSDDDKTDYPATTVLGERTCTGRIIALPNPPDGSSEVPLPGAVLALETESGGYILSHDGQWIWEETVTVGGTVYTIQDRVEVSGTASMTKISATENYTELSIKTIRKLGVE